MNAVQKDRLKRVCVKSNVSIRFKFRSGHDFYWEASVGGREFTTHFETASVHLVNVLDGAYI